MEIVPFAKKFLEDTPARQEVEITIRPQTRSKKHSHKASCTSEVVYGTVFEIRDGTKTYYEAGSVMPEIEIEKPHIVGNDGREEALLRNIYKPALIMEYFDDNEIDILLCNTPGIPT